MKTARPERVRFLVPVKQTPEGAVLLWERDPDRAFRKGEVDGFAVLLPALKGTAPPPPPRQSRGMSAKQWHRAQTPARWSRIALVEVDSQAAASRKASRAGRALPPILPPEAARMDAKEPSSTRESALSPRGDRARSSESSSQPDVQVVASHHPSSLDAPFSDSVDVAQEGRERAQRVIDSGAAASPETVADAAVATTDSLRSLSPLVASSSSRRPSTERNDSAMESQASTGSGGRRWELMDRARHGAVPAAVRPDSPAQAAENTAVTLLNGLLDGAGFQPGRRAGQRAALWNDGDRPVSPGEANALPQRVAGLLADGVPAGVLAGALWAILRARFAAAPVGVLPAAITLDELARRVRGTSISANPHPAGRRDCASRRGHDAGCGCAALRRLTPQCLR